MWTCNLEGSQKNKVLNVLGEEDGAGLDARNPKFSITLIFLKMN